MSENPQEFDIRAIAQGQALERSGMGKKAGLPDADGLQEKLDLLTDKYQELYCLSRAMWELVREKTDLREEDLLAQLAVVKAAQQMATKPKAAGCPQCDRPLQRIEGKHHRCIYCGYVEEFKSPFDRLL